MNERNSHILMAAHTMFARYGYGKTTMSDIAAEAGVARQTVYNAYPSKTEILRAVMKASGEKTIAAVVAAWSDAPGLEEKLTAFQDLGPVAWFEAVRSTPDWAELLEGFHQAASLELEAIYQRFEILLHELFRKEANLAGSDLDDMVEFFLFSSMNAKYGAEDVNHLKRRLNTIRAATMALINGSGSP